MSDAWRDEQLIRLDEVTAVVESRLLRGLDRMPAPPDSSATRSRVAWLAESWVH